jgi:hypothetical protein
MDVVVEPKARRPISAYLPLVLVAPAAVFSYFFAGAIFLVYLAVGVAALLFLLWIGPKINRKGNLPEPSASADLTAVAVLDKVVGQVELDSGMLTWTPWRGRKGKGHSPVAVPLWKISTVALQPLPGVPSSYRVNCEVEDGSAVEMTLYGDLNDFAHALRTS